MCMDYNIFIGKLNSLGNVEIFCEKMSVNV